MTNEQQKLKQVVSDYFKLDLTPVDDREYFDLSKVVVRDSLTRSETVKNWGTFELQAFTGGSDDRYKLVMYDGDFPRRHNLVQAMKDAEHFDVKGYKLIKPSKAISGYFLYQLIPIMVGGKPYWF